ncbi:glycosyltransferase, partial [Actinocorallia lasiicapitis]
MLAVAGRLDGEENVETAVAAFALLADAFPEWSMRITGTGPRRAAVRALIDACALQDQVRIVGDGPRWADVAARLVLGPVHAGSAFTAGVPVVAWAG